MHKRHICMVALAVFLGFGLAVYPDNTEAGVLSRTVSKVAARKAAQREAAQKAYAKKVLERDVARDTATQAKAMQRDTIVRRYTSWQQARKESVHGIWPGTHMTARITKGRPISAQSAMERYGLRSKPDARMTIRIPEGHPVKKNKVIGGKPGYGEITSTKPLSSENIIYVQKMK